MFNISDLKYEVERVFHKYRIYKRMEKINRPYDIKITPAYEPREHGNTNTISNPVESLVIRELDAEQERRDFIGLVESCLDALEGLKKEIIVERYTKGDSVTDNYVLESVLGISGLLYRKTRDAAIKELSYYLGFTNDVIE